jgi:hypothetical protein
MLILLFPAIVYRTFYCKKCNKPLSTWHGDAKVRRRAYKRLGLPYLDIWTDYICTNENCENGKIQRKITDRQIKVNERYTRFLYYKRHKKRIQKSLKEKKIYDTLFYSK